MISVWIHWFLCLLYKSPIKCALSQFIYQFKQIISLPFFFNTDLQSIRLYRLQICDQFLTVACQRLATENIKHGGQSERHFTSFRINYNLYCECYVSRSVFCLWSTERLIRTKASIICLNPLKTKVQKNANNVSSILQTSKDENFHILPANGKR